MPARLASAAIVVPILFRFLNGAPQALRKYFAVFLISTWLSGRLIRVIVAVFFIILEPIHQTGIKGENTDILQRRRVSKHLCVCVPGQSPSDISEGYLMCCKPHQIVPLPLLLFDCPFPGGGLAYSRQNTMASVQGTPAVVVPLLLLLFFHERAVRIVAKT